MRGMNYSMYDFVMAQLQERKGSWPAVSRGSGVSIKTLSKIARREIKDPGVSHIQALHDFFTGSRKAA